MWYIDAMIWTHSVAGKVAGGYYLNDKTVYPNGPPSSGPYMIKSYAFLHTLLRIFNYWLLFSLFACCIMCCAAVKKSADDKKNKDNH